MAVKISPERPHRVHSSGFVGWVGNVVPSIDDDSDFLLCEGEGAVFVSLPQAGERLARPAASSAGT